jgi:hypothetical protein
LHAGLPSGRLLNIIKILIFKKRKKQKKNKKKKLKIKNNLKNKYLKKFIKKIIYLKNNIIKKY